MRSPYLCAYHAERLKVCESEAFRYWGEMMRRGVQAYVECRFDAAVLYLGTALEIGLLRQRCQLNGLFGAMHVQKPVEFLVELLKIDGQSQEVKVLLEYVAAHTTSSTDVGLSRFPQTSAVLPEGAYKPTTFVPSVNMANAASSIH